VLSCAKESVTVTWRTVTGDGNALAPSPFVGDLEELSANVENVFPNSTSFVPMLDEACSMRDVRNASADITGRSIASMFPEEFRAIDAGVRVERARYSREPFGAYDGVLGNPATITALGEIYGTSHAFSAAQLETYARCPFQFFLERVLNIEVVDAAETGFDRRTRGRVLHEVLQEFHQTFTGTPTAQIPEKEADETMSRLCAEIFSRHARREVTVPRGILEVEHLRMSAELARYLQQAREANEPWQPSHFEVAFGQAHGTPKNALTAKDAFPLKLEKGIALLSGRIDRIDMKNGNARIIDYKTTLPSSNAAFRDGVALQTMLYAIALEEHVMPGTECEEARLVQPGRAKEKVVMERDGDASEWQTMVRDQVSKCIHGIRNGIFPPAPYDKQCFVCKSSRACRYEQWRIDLKSEPSR